MPDVEKKEEPSEETDDNTPRFQYHRDYIDPETNKHDRMKLLGRKILLYMGIHSKDISEEVTVCVDEDCTKRYRIDLVGRLGNLKIGIECGDNKAEKIDALRKKMDVLLILPYKEFDFQSQPEIQIYKKVLSDFEEAALTSYLQQDKLRKLQQETQKLYDQIKYEMEKEMKQIRDDLRTLSSQIGDSRLDLAYLREFKDFCERFGKGAYEFPKWASDNTIVVHCPNCKQRVEVKDPNKVPYYKSLIVNGVLYCPMCHKEVMSLK